MQAEEILSSLAALVHEALKLGPTVKVDVIAVGKSEKGVRANVIITFMHEAPKAVFQPVTSKQRQHKTPPKRSSSRMKEPMSLEDADIKFMRAHLSLYKAAGALNDNQLLALSSTDGKFATSLSQEDRVQIRNVFDDVRRAKGLIQ